MKWWWGNRRRAEWKLVNDSDNRWVRLVHARCGRDYLVETLDEAEDLSRGHVCPKEL